MANNPYNFYTNPNDLQDTDIWAFSRDPHTGGTTFKTSALNVLDYILLKTGASGIDLPPFGEFGPALDYYEVDLSDTFLIHFIQTPSGTPADLPCRIQRIGKVVQLGVLGITVTATTSAAFVTDLGAIPVKWKPIDGVIQPIVVVDNSTRVFGALQITVDGQVIIGVGAGQANFTNTGQAAILNFSISYLTSGV